jgi:hypothetical protein
MFLLRFAIRDARTGEYFGARMGWLPGLSGALLYTNEPEPWREGLEVIKLILEVTHEEKH